MFASLRGVRSPKVTTRRLPPSAVPVGDFGQKKRMKRRASSPEAVRPFFLPEIAGFFYKKSASDKEGIFAVVVKCSKN